MQKVVDSSHDNECDEDEDVDHGDDDDGGDDDNDDDSVVDGDDGDGVVDGDDDQEEKEDGDGEASVAEKDERKNWWHCPTPIMQHPLMMMMMIQKMMTMMMMMKMMTMMMLFNSCSESTIYLQTLFDFDSKAAHSEHVGKNNLRSCAFSPSSNQHKLGLHF